MSETESLGCVQTCQELQIVMTDRAPLDAEHTPLESRLHCT